MVVQDPEGILGAPVPHHIARREFAKKVAEDAEYKEKVERQLQAEKEARRLAREVTYFYFRVIKLLASCVYQP